MVADTANDGSTALHHASTSGSLETIQLLLDNGSDVHAVTKDGSNMLHYALSEIAEGSSAVVDLLVQRGVDPCKARHDGIVPVQLLIGDYTHDEYYSWQKEKDEREKAIRIIALLTSNTYFEGWTPFQRICLLQPSAKSDSLLNVFREFLAGGADLGCKDPTGKTALRSLADVWQRSCSQGGISNTREDFSKTSTSMMHLAMGKVPLTGPSHDVCTDPFLTITALLNKDEKLVKKLLEHSPDVDLTVDGMSIIKAACLHGCSRMLLQDLLVRSKISSKKEQGSGLIRVSCEANLFNSHEIVEDLLKASLSPNENCPVSGESPLMIAARHGNVNIMNLLISNEASLNVSDKNGCNIVHHAVEGSHLSSFHILRDTEIEWNRKANCVIHSVQLSGVTPFHLAASLPNNSILEYLIDEGLVDDIDAQTDTSDTALYIAAWSSRPQNVSTLLARKANSKVRSRGECPIHAAIRFGNESVVAVFLQYQFDVEVLHDSGLNCEMLALKYSHKDVAKTIREHKGDQSKSIRIEYSITLIYTLIQP